MIDSADVQVLFADLQPGLIAGSRTVAAEALVRTAGALARVAAILDLPTTFSVVDVEGLDPKPVEKLHAAAATACVLLRRPISPFRDAKTAEAIAASGRRTIILAGFAAEALVVHAALDARRFGYEIHLACDAIGGISERGEAAAFRRMENAGCIPSCVFTVASMMTTDFTAEPGNRILAALHVLR